jgi:hypothetical protein
MTIDAMLSSSAIKCVCDAELLMLHSWQVHIHMQDARHGEA